MYACMLYGASLYPGQLWVAQPLRIYHPVGSLGCLLNTSSTPSGALYHVWLPVFRYWSLPVRIYPVDYYVSLQRKSPASESLIRNSKSQKVQYVKLSKLSVAEKGWIPRVYSPPPKEEGDSSTLKEGSAVSVGISGWQLTCYSGTSQFLPLLKREQPSADRENKCQHTFSISSSFQQHEAAIASSCRSCRISSVGPPIRNRDS